MWKTIIGQLNRGFVTVVQGRNFFSLIRKKDPNIVFVKKS